MHTPPSTRQRIGIRRLNENPDLVTCRHAAHQTPLVHYSRPARKVFFLFEDTAKGQGGRLSVPWRQGPPGPGTHATGHGTARLKSLCGSFFMQVRYARLLKKKKSTLRSFFNRRIFLSCKGQGSRQRHVRRPTVRGATWAAAGDWPGRTWARKGRPPVRCSVRPRLGAPRTTADGGGWLPPRGRARRRRPVLDWTCD